MPAATVVAGRDGNDFISDDRRIRQSDVIWQMRRKGKKKERLYLLLELQSTSHPFMALRMLTYAGLLLKEILRKERVRSGSGPLAEEKRRRVEEITSPARLKRLADKVLAAGSLDEMGI
jgi:hypothetical protein